MIAPFIGVTFPAKWWAKPWIVAAIVRFWPKEEKERLDRWLKGIDDVAKRDEVMARVNSILK
jgi:hypothetical protein